MHAQWSREGPFACFRDCWEIDRDGMDLLRLGGEIDRGWGEARRFVPVKRDGSLGRGGGGATSD